ncbi:MAG: hypothetical protein HOW73_35575 [Polyangiaceae bacterium]|nr:hypothetical protein [Polyangiaceae bacterium]
MAFVDPDASRAIAATRGLLRDIGLDSYLFELQPTKTGWIVCIRYLSITGWQTSRFAISRTRLFGASAHAPIRPGVLEEWSDWLADRRRPSRHVLRPVPPAGPKRKKTPAPQEQSSAAADAE